LKHAAQHVVGFAALLRIIASTQKLSSIFGIEPQNLAAFPIAKTSAAARQS
jgi:hypothetical protein